MKIIIQFLLKHYSEINDRLHLLGLQNLHSDMLHKLKEIIDQEKLFDGTYFEYSLFMVVKMQHP